MDIINGNKTKKFYDKQYATHWGKEVSHLSSKGIKYKFVYTKEDGVKVYKYKRTAELFMALTELYNELGLHEQEN